MLERTLTKAGVICLVLALGVWATPDALAQTQGRGQQPPPRQGGPPQGQQPSQGQEGQQQQQASPSSSSEPFIHGLFVGIGLGAYQGDVDGNPNLDPIRYLGSAKLRAEVAIDHRRGKYEQYGFEGRLSFVRMDGAARGWGQRPSQSLRFSANVLNLDVVADYELPYIAQGFLRVFAGGGPSFVISPSYTGFPSNSDLSEANQSLFRPNLGTRVTGSLVAGATIFDVFRIGVRMYPSDYIDGYSGFNDGGVPDFVGFVSFGKRFNLRN